MKFDVDMLKQRAEETIQKIFEIRGQDKNAAQDKLEKLRTLSPGEAGNWISWLHDLEKIVEQGHPITDFDLQIDRGRPKTLEEKAGGAYHLRQLRNQSIEPVNLTDPPARLQRFIDFLSMTKSTEISSNELKTHGFAGLESMFNPNNYK